MLSFLAKFGAAADRVRVLVGERLAVIFWYAKDRGCTRPGCDVPGYWSEVHHVEEWATTHCTDVNTLALACGSDHPLVKPGGWVTRKRKDGNTEWIPPPHLDYGHQRLAVVPFKGE